MVIIAVIGVFLSYVFLHAFLAAVGKRSRQIRQAKKNGTIRLEYENS